MVKLPGIERTQTGVRIATPVLKVLKALAEYKDMSLGDLIEGVVLHAFDGKLAFSDETRAVIDTLRDVYDCRLTSADSHKHTDPAPAGGGPMHKQFSHEIRISAPVTEAFPLFTPKGEEAWVPGWAPRYLQPEDGETRADMVFTTGAGEEETVWTCLAWQPADWHARYLRVTPSSRVAFVDVRCRPDGAAHTRVTVSYRMIALTDPGRRYIEAMTPARFARMIDDWSALIHDTL